MTKDENTYIVKAKAFERIIKTLLEKAPRFLDEITKALANETFVKRFGVSVSMFYFTLEQEGMDEKKAMELTKEYIRMFNVAAVVKNFEKMKDVAKVMGVFSELEKKESK